MTAEKKRRKVKKWWPHHILTLSAFMLAAVFLIGWLAELYPVPDDAPAMIPMPDHGENIPGPEWLFLLFWQPFWFWAGIRKKYLIWMTIVPILISAFLVFLPYFHKLPLRKIPGLGALLKKARNMESGRIKSFLYAIPALLFAIAFSVGVYKSGHQAKVLGCDACHNPAMGPRMAVPPANVAKYYNVDRAMQIQVGKYRAGKTSGVNEQGEQILDVGGDEGGYKDANWQMRHMYEPTFTW